MQPMMQPQMGITRLPLVMIHCFGRKNILWQVKKERDGFVMVVPAKDNEHSASECARWVPKSCIEEIEHAGNGLLRCASRWYEGDIVLDLEGRLGMAYFDFATDRFQARFDGQNAFCCTGIMSVATPGAERLKHRFVSQVLQLRTTCKSAASFGTLQWDRRRGICTSPMAVIEQSFRDAIRCIATAYVPRYVLLGSRSYSGERYKRWTPYADGWHEDFIHIGIENIWIQEVKKLAFGFNARHFEAVRYHSILPDCYVPGHGEEIVFYPKKALWNYNHLDFMGDDMDLAYKQHVHRNYWQHQIHLTIVGDMTLDTWVNRDGDLEGDVVQYQGPDAYCVFFHEGRLAGFHQQWGEYCCDHIVLQAKNTRFFTTI